MDASSHVTFFKYKCGKNCNVCLKRKDAEDGPFKKNKNIRL